MAIGPGTLLNSDQEALAHPYQTRLWVAFKPSYSHRELSTLILMLTKTIPRPRGLRERFHKKPFR
jgi:hypothetical protein